MTIRESIIHFQTESGLSNLQICNSCEINVSSYSLFRKGKRTLPYEKLQLIIDLLNLKISRNECN